MSSPARPVRAPLLWLLLPLMAGLSAAKIWPPPEAGLGSFLLGAALAAFLALWAAWADRPHVAMPALVIAGALAGFNLMHLREPRLHVWETRAPREITLTLRVNDTFGSAPAARSLGGIGVIVATGPHDREMIGQRVYFSAIRRISVPAHRSAHYEVRGVLEPLLRESAQDGFNDYLTNLGVRHRLTRAQLLRETVPPGRWPLLLSAFRERLVRILRHRLERHPKTASLYLAMLLGEKAALSPEQENAFMRSGTFHVFCVSGLHVGVIALALRELGPVMRLPPRAGAVMTLGVLWLYVQITGTGTPAVRAYIMIAFLLSSRTLRLPGNALAALAASALVALLLDPLQLFSSGFQMSYSVVAALILLAGPLGDRWLAFWQPFVLRPRPEWRWWHETVAWAGRKVIAGAAGCWAAFLGSATAGIGYFGLFSPGSLLANLVIMPLSSLAIIAGFLSLLTGLLGLWPLCALFNSAAAVIIIAADGMLRHGTGLPGVYYEAAFRTSWLAPAGMAAMTAVMLAGAAGRWKERHGGFWPPVVLLVLLLLLGVKFG